MKRILWYKFIDIQDSDYLRLRMSVVYGPKTYREHRMFEAIALGDSLENEPKVLSTIISD